MRISKKQREAAIDACLLRADEWVACRGYPGTETTPDAPAYTAYNAVALITRNAIPGEIEWLEAAALLRGDDEHEPWCPGDHVYLLSKGRP